MEKKIFTERVNIKLCNWQLTMMMCERIRRITRKEKAIVNMFGILPDCKKLFENCLNIRG